MVLPIGELPSTTSYRKGTWGGGLRATLPIYFQTFRTGLAGLLVGIRKRSKQSCMRTAWGTDLHPFPDFRALTGSEMASGHRLIGASAYPDAFLPNRRIAAIHNESKRNARSRTWTKFTGVVALTTLWGIRPARIVTSWIGILREDEETNDSRYKVASRHPSGSDLFCTSRRFLQCARFRL